MQITGPFTPSSSVPNYYDDPAVHTQASAAVQLQNNSGLALIVTAGGTRTSIMPYTAATVAVTGAPTIIVTASATQSSRIGSLTLVWLLVGESSAQPDGPLNVFLTTYQSLTVVGQSTPTRLDNLAPNAAQVVLGWTSYTGGTVTLTATGTQSGTVYATITLLLGNSTPPPWQFSVNGMIDNSVTITSTGAGVVFTGLVASAAN